MHEPTLRQCIPESWIENCNSLLVAENDLRHVHDIWPHNRLTSETFLVRVVTSKRLALFAPTVPLHVQWQRMTYRGTYKTFDPITGWPRKHSWSVSWPLSHFRYSRPPLHTMSVSEMKYITVCLMGFDVRNANAKTKGKHLHDLWKQVSFLYYYLKLGPAFTEFMTQRLKNHPMCYRVQRSWWSES